jgi:ATP-dependent Clp protease adaptor protein ClpS
LQLKIGAAAVALMGHPVLSHAGLNPMLATAVLTPPVVTPPLVAPPQVAPPEAALPPLGSVTPDRESGGAAVMEKAPERVRKPSPRYKVLLHNDPVNSMEYVVTTLRQVVPSLSEQDAIAVMLEAHNTGIGLVIVCDIEPAEFYCETLKAKGLSSTIEPES